MIEIFKHSEQIGIRKEKSRAAGAKKGIMPVSIRRLKGGRFQVRTPHGVNARHTTKRKAMRQRRLLNAIDHGFVPRKHRR